MITNEEWGELHRLLNKYYIAYKLWSEEDIRIYLDEHGYPPTDENVTTFLEHMDTDGLFDCNDYDWEVFAQALWDCKDKLEGEQE